MRTEDKEIQIDYKNRIDSVFRFIDENLDSKLPLNTVAKIASFSPFLSHSKL